MQSAVSRTSRNAVGPAVNSAKPPVRRRAIAPAAVEVAEVDAEGRDAASAVAEAAAAIAVEVVVDTAVVAAAAVDDRCASASPQPAPSAASKQKYPSSRRKVARFIAARVIFRARIPEWAAVEAAMAEAVAAEDTTTRATILQHGFPTSIDRIEVVTSGSAA